MLVWPCSATWTRLFQKKEKGVGISISNSIISTNFLGKDKKLRVDKIKTFEMILVDVRLAIIFKTDRNQTWPREIMFDINFSPPPFRQRFILSSVFKSKPLTLVSLPTIYLRFDVLPSALSPKRTHLCRLNYHLFRS